MRNFDLSCLLNTQKVQRRVNKPNKYNPVFVHVHERWIRNITFRRRSSQPFSDAGAAVVFSSHFEFFLDTAIPVRTNFKIYPSQVALYGRKTIRTAKVCGGFMILLICYRNLGE